MNLFHPVVSDHRFLHVEARGMELLVGNIQIPAAEEERGVAVSGNAGRIRRCRPLVVRTPYSASARHR